MGISIKTTIDEADITVGKTQADGAFTIRLDQSNTVGSDDKFNHQLQVEIIDGAGAPAVATAGVLALSMRSTGAVQFEDILGSIDMAAGPRIKIFSAFIGELKFAPTGFDADKKYNVTLVSGD